MSISTLLSTPPAKPTTKALKIFYYPLDGIGHLNASLGLAQTLAKRGHKIYFLIEEAFTGKCTKYGFNEILLRKANAPQISATEMIVAIAERMRNSGFLSPESSLDKLRTQNNNPDAFVMMSECYASTLEYEPQIEAAIKREKPNLIIVDHFLIPVAIQQSSIPWVFQVSMQPLAAINSNGKLPPFSSGYPAGKDPSFYREYLEEWKIGHDKFFTKYQDQLDRDFGHSPAQSVRSDGNVVPKSPYFNFYGYPKELDYNYDLPETLWARIDAFVREETSKEDSVFELPDQFQSDNTQKLIYLSLGTIASIDVPLMKRILSILGNTKHRYIVSKGQLADQYELPANSWGAASLPQTKILPLVDLVITHGGNNTVTETFYHGKPMIVLPFFADQIDNAQRIHETGYGIRLEPYSFEDQQLVHAIEQLLNDKALKLRLEEASNRIQNSNSKEVVCEKIEKIVEKFSSDKLSYLLDAYH